MSVFKRPLMQKNDCAGSGSGGTPKCVCKKGPLGEGCMGPTEKAREVLRTLKEGLNAKLLTAAKKGFRWDAERAVESGAEVNAVDEAGKSVLDCAKESGNASLVRFLEGKGAKSAKDL